MNDRAILGFLALAFAVMVACAFVVVSGAVRALRESAPCVCTDGGK